jgi:porin
MAISSTCVVRWAAVWAGLFALALSDAAFAQDVDPPAANGPTAPDAETSADVRVNQRDLAQDSPLLPPAHLFGDWFGLRSRLDDRGITPTVTWVSDMVGNPVGGLRHGFTEAENLGIDFVCDLEKLRGIDDTKFHVSMSQRSGVGLSKDYIGNVFPVQEVYGGETFKLVDVDIERAFADGAIDVRLGRMAVGDEFLVSPYFWAFVNNGIDGTPKGIFFNAPGTSAYPSAAWGTRLRVRPTERTYVMAGAYNGDTDVWDDSNHGMDWSLHGPLFAIAEVGYIRNGLANDEGLLGHYKLGAYYNGGSFTNSAGRVLGPTAANFGLTSSTSRGNWGFYTVFDQVLYNPGGRGDPRGLGVFGSVVVAPDDTINEMPFFCDAGVVIRGLLPRRPTDSIGFGVVYGQFSDDLAAVQQLAQTVSPAVGVQDYELALEWFYRVRMRDGAAFVQPDLQYIINPDGTGLISNALVVGLQIGLNF